MDGGRVKIHRSLTEPLLIAGAPREFVIINGTITAALVFGAHSVLYIPVALAVHMVGVVLTRRDPLWLSTYKRHLRHQAFYEG